MANDEMDRVVPLGQLDDFKVAEGDPDVRGWNVVSADGRKLGEVDELLIDTGAMKVRYLDVDVDDAMLATGEDRHVLVPIGYARLDRDDDRIIVDNLQAEQLRTLPAYGHQPLTRDFETSVRDSWSTLGTTGAAAASTRATDDDFYGHESFDENRFYGARRDTGASEERLTLSEEELQLRKQRMEAGEVDIRKRVETEHVRETVPVRHEEAVIERRPLSGADAMNAQARIEGDEIRIPLSEEEVTVEKRVVPKEELVVKKREVVENEVVEADLRRERADVTREGNVEVRDNRTDRTGRDDRI